MNISVIGAGSWGTTLANLVAQNGYKVVLWARERSIVDEINTSHKNSNYLKGISLSENLSATNDLKEASSDKDIIISAVPSQFLRRVMSEMSASVKKGAIIVSVTKGLEEGSYKRMSEIIKEEVPQSNVVALSGPNHAEEVSKGIPTATVIASEDPSHLEPVKQILSNDFFKPYPHDDIIGVEICGAVKNITAIAAGVVSALGFGDSAKGSILTLGLTEINNFGRAFGAKQSTCYGLAGVGDLVATCTSEHSRNRFVGTKIAEGKSMDEIKEEMHGMVAEGIKTTKSVYDYSVANSIDMPLTTQVYKVLYERKDLGEAIRDLITLI